MTVSQPPLDDAALLASFVERKDHAAFRALVDRYHRLVYSACYRTLNGNGASAEDATQAVFILLVRNAPRINAASLPAWLFKTATQVTHTLRRAEVRRRKRETSMAKPDNAPPTEADSPDHQVLHAAISKLPPKQRDAVLLYYFNGLEQSAIGLRLGCSAKAIQKRIEYALATLRARLKNRHADFGVVLLALENLREIRLPANLPELCHAATAAAPNSPAARLATETLHHAAEKAHVLIATSIITALLLSAMIYLYVSYPGGAEVAPVVAAGPSAPELPTPPAIAPAPAPVAPSAPIDPAVAPQPWKPTTSSYRAQPYRPTDSMLEPDADPLPVQPAPIAPAPAPGQIAQIQPGNNPNKPAPETPQKPVPVTTLPSTGSCLTITPLPNRPVDN